MNQIAHKIEISIRNREYSDNYWNVIEYTEKYAIENNLNHELQFQLKDLRDFYRLEFLRKVKEINGGLSFLLIIVTFGIWGLIVLYKQNKAWDELQKFEQLFDQKLNLLWDKLGLTKSPLNFNIDTSIERSFVLYIFLSIITLGIWGIVWEYKMHVDPDNIFHEFHSAEDTVIQTIRQ